MTVRRARGETDTCDRPAPRLGIGIMPTVGNPRQAERVLGRQGYPTPGLSWWPGGSEGGVVLEILEMVDGFGDTYKELHGSFRKAALGLSLSLPPIFPPVAEGLGLLFEFARGYWCNLTLRGRQAAPD